jgi:hypothetical protein
MQTHKLKMWTDDATGDGTSGGHTRHDAREHLGPALLIDKQHKHKHHIKGTLDAYLALRLL